MTRKRTLRDESRFVGIKSTAAMLGVSYSAVWESLRRGDFPVPNIRVGNRWLISRVALERLCNGEEAPHAE